MVDDLAALPSANLDDGGAVEGSLEEETLPPPGP